MKYFFLLFASIVVSGCNSFLLLPKDHDPVLAGAFIETRLQINKLECANREDFSWKLALQHSNFVKEYSFFRDDPQKESANAVKENLEKALNAKSEKMCNHWLNLTESRMSALETAWKGR